MKAVTVGAVKKTKHGAYGRVLATVTVTVADDMWEQRAHAAALPLLQAQVPSLKITTAVLEVRR